ncbi:hypothetical protein PanWU01x14_286620, partial [Parasponia andersonii]
ANHRGDKLAGELRSAYDSLAARSLMCNLLAWEYHASHQFPTYYRRPCEVHRRPTRVEGCVVLVFHPSSSNPSS